MVCMVSRVKQGIWKCFRSMELDFGKFLVNVGYGKVKEKMMR